MADAASIVDTLILKTVDGRVPWKPTAAPNTFIAAIDGRTTFEITRDEGAYSFSMSDSRGNKIIEVTGLGPFELAQGVIPYNSLATLYDVARRLALDVDKKIEDAKSLLDNL